MQFDWKGLRFTALFVVGVSLLFYGSQAATKFVSEGMHPSSELADAGRADYRVISQKEVEEIVPKAGKFMVADLVAMKLTLYASGTPVADYPILTKGRAGTPWETPAGQYSIEAKVGNHFSSIGDVYMPYSMQFYGNYFIHGWPYYPDGTPVASTFSGGCIRLSTPDAEKVYQFAEKGTGVYVYDPGTRTPKAGLALGLAIMPRVTAESFLVADVDTGDVYLEHNAHQVLPIASITKLMTALVGNEMISLERYIAVPEGEIVHPKVPEDTKMRSFLVGNLFYPLLMESNNQIADSIASSYGKYAFIDRMNETALSLGMKDTHYSDDSGISPENVSTADDLFRLAVYLSNKKSFVWDITRTPEKTITALDGTAFKFNNFNLFSAENSFVGGKVGHTTAAKDTMLSVFNVPVNGETRRIAVVVLQSAHNGDDTSQLVSWFDRAVRNNLASTNVFRKIQMSDPVPVVSVGDLSQN